MPVMGIRGVSDFHTATLIESTANIQMVTDVDNLQAFKSHIPALRMDIEKVDVPRIIYETLCD